MSTLIPFPGERIRRPEMVPVTPASPAPAAAEPGSIQTLVSGTARDLLWTAAGALTLLLLLAGCGYLVSRHATELNAGTVADFELVGALAKASALPRGTDARVLADQIEPLAGLVSERAPASAQALRQLTSELRSTIGSDTAIRGRFEAALEASRSDAANRITTALSETSAHNGQLRAIAALGLILAMLMVGGGAAWIHRERHKRAEIEYGMTRTLGEARSLADSLRRLGEFGELLQSCRSIAETMLMLRSAAPSLLGSTSGSVYLLRADRQRLERTGVFGQPSSGPSDFSSYDCWAMRRNQIHPPAGDIAAACCNHASGAAMPATGLCLPLSAQGSSIGVLCLETATPLDAARRRLCLAMAEKLSLSLSNIALQDSLRMQSLRDPLTGLFNRRYLDESLPRELARASRRRAPLSLLIVDIDHFKQINDRHGHDAGDVVLAQVGALLAARSREEDIVCRVGGEEFLLIMPDADLGVATRRAEQLREAVAAMRARFEHAEIGKVTVSIGVAQWNGDSRDGDSLRQAADRALYEAKRGGRDRVVAAGSA